ncbi:MAG: GntR family transcriptional regulator [Pseudomonas sp.]|jgi:DNA-binding GntR family transcriptional regulator|nr:GntR family transcriptional regulator [Pseudomonas sp.]MDD2223685.1 GntR family transcriptional regulator [Pseudomonas sp.]MDY0415251.1 GntR family transcriptional regulator [Pseudomonas sp.]NLO53902.1 GntR family transcriptional regulator [Gammaproteobacteria bacterium]
MLQHDAGSLTQNLADALAQRIICGELVGGTALREVAITDAYQVSRSSVREALLLLQRRYLVDIFPRRGAQVRILTAQNVQDLYDLSTELYILLGTLLTQRWQTQGQLLPFLEVRRAMQLSVQKNDVEGFVKHCFAVVDVAAPIVNNLYLQQALANIIPAVSRTYYLAFKQRCPEMAQLTRIFDQLLVAVQARQPEDIRVLLQSYAQTNCQLALRALPREC